MQPSHRQYQTGYGLSTNESMMTQRNDRGAQQSQLTGLDVLAQGSQYALQKLHDANLLSAAPYPNTGNEGVGPNHAQNQANDQSNGKSGTGPVRKRISRACDQCNQLRTKCDGKTPCAHCVGKGAQNAEIFVTTCL